jgi:Zn-dependent oligopeptidase
VLSFESVLYPLIDISLRVSRVWSPVGNLLSLKGTPELRQAAEQARPLVVGFFNDMLLDARVYELVTLFAESSFGKRLRGERARYLSQTLRDLKLAGANLGPESKIELKEINLKLADLSRRFSDNVTDSKFELILTEKDDLRGLPQEVIVASHRRADTFREKLGAHVVPTGAALFTLDYPSFVPFMRFSERGDLRKKLSFAYLQQGSAHATRGLLQNADSTNTPLDNKEISTKVCSLSAQKAKLLGFKNYAELSLATKMAKTPTRVQEFLESLAKRVKPIAQKEKDALISFQNEICYNNGENQPQTLFPWDREFLCEKLRKSRYNFDSQEAKPYFELRQTLNGIFSVATKLFGISFTRADGIDTWHDDVETYKVVGEEGQHLGLLYLDLYPREMKDQGAWVNPLLNGHHNSVGAYHAAQCILVCNLTPPATDTPSLLSFEEANTLFHEFGHALHHLLSKVELEPLAGLNVPYDFVELPSQLFENFCSEAISLKTFARHYQTGAEMPEELLSKMIVARKLFAGLTALRQLEFGLFDLAVFTQDDSAEYDLIQLYRNVIENYGVIPFWEGTLFPYSFSHIFGGSYAAGYYSYKWSEVLEADAFTRFKEDGVLSEAVGRAFRDTILSRGDSKEALELFADFMGREPKEDALLKKLENTL